MHVLPLIIRELNVAARRPSTYWLRLACGGGTMALAVWMILVWGASSVFSGRTFFYLMCGLTEVAVIFSGFFFTLDAISLERRDGTLPLLFLTNLDAADVVYGKLAAVASVPFLTLIGTFPALALFQLMGGVPAADLSRALAALLATLFSCVTSTLLVSCVARKRSSAALGAALLLLATNPASLLFKALAIPPGRFWSTLAGYLALGTLFLLAATILLRKNWRECESEKVERRRSPAPPNEAIPASLEHTPATWLMARRWRARPLARRMEMLLLLTALTGIAWPLTRQASPVFPLLVLLVLHLLLLALLLARTTHAFFTDRHEGSLELLLTTPLANEEIFAGFARFFHARALPLLALVSVFDLLISGLLALQAKPKLASFPVTMAVTLCITVGGIRWLGVYRALIDPRPLLAAFATFWRLSFFPMILSALFLWAPNTDYLKVCVFWTTSTAFLALFFGSDARRVLLERGRDLLKRPSSEKPPHIESEWSFINWEGIEEPKARSPMLEPAVQ